ncbi:restriction endonuclease subunit S [Yunchengibacter salinarum]|uniref:restriction endonuclease subunit S n=1 Tax=Yunchengibacter salinarum TaxID=3133399 RepID=UPI0035B5F516
MRITELLEFNPSTRLTKSGSYPFIEMALLPLSEREIPGYEYRAAGGSGSKFRNGDTLLARITPCLENGKGGLVRNLPGDGLGHGSTEFIVMRPCRKSDEDFVYYLSRLPRFRSFAIQQMTGTSGRQRVNWQSLADFEIPELNPCIRENIGSTLATLDDKIELNRRMNETLEAMARAIFKDWFVDFGPTRAKAEGRAPYLAPEIWNLFPDALDDGDTPVGWTVYKLEDFLELIYGKSLPAKQRTPGNVAVYGSGGLAGTHDTALIEGPAVIVGRKGTVGSLYWEDRPVFPIDTVFYVVPRIGSLLFNYHLLGAQPLSDMNTDAAVPGLNRGNAYRLEFPKPSSELISAFDDLAGPLWKLRAANLREMGILAETRDLLLPKLMSGEIRLRDAEKAVEAVA